ncbi:hypothetical protein HK102_002290 [Quaeritorhiza haematococci]|nr:hypothetical protein HK102_002290 [Quaeritorhiza haematococci]
MPFKLGGAGVVTSRARSIRSSALFARSSRELLKESFGKPSSPPFSNTTRVVTNLNPLPHVFSRLQYFQRAELHASTTLRIACTCDVIEHHKSLEQDGEDDGSHWDKQGRAMTLDELNNILKENMDNSEDHEDVFMIVHQCDPSEYGKTGQIESSYEIAATEWLKIVQELGLSEKDRNLFHVGTVRKNDGKPVKQRDDEHGGDDTQPDTIRHVYMSPPRFRYFGQFRGKDKRKHHQVLMHEDTAVDLSTLSGLLAKRGKNVYVCFFSCFMTKNDEGGRVKDGRGQRFLGPLKTKRPGHPFSMTCL